MKKIQLLIVLSALAVTSFQSIEAATSACQPPSKMAVMAAAGNCSAPMLPSEITFRSGLNDNVVKACLKVLKEEGLAVTLASGHVCCPTG